MQWMVSIPAAMGLGALHSLEPGHGKGMMTAYLTSRRAGVREAVLLGAVSAMSHTVTIAVLGLGAQYVVNAVLPMVWVYLVQVLAGVAVCILGARLVARQYLPKVTVIRKLGVADSAEHAHHTHGHHHHHHHPEEAAQNLTDVFTMGVWSGLIPCPTALAILLSSMGSHAIYSGFILVGAFSIGMAMTMCTLGIVVVRTQSALEHLNGQRVAVKIAKLSSLLVLFLGAAVVWDGVQHLLPFTP